MSMFTDSLRQSCRDGYLMLLMEHVRDLLFFTLPLHLPVDLGDCT